MDMHVKINERNHKFASFKLFSLDYSLQTFLCKHFFYLQIPCDNLLGLALLCVFPCVFVTFSYGVSGQEWYMFVLIPDLCLLL